jgi:hypothetical protein
MMLGAMRPTGDEFFYLGGEGGIRTHGTRKGSTVFETARFNHSRTSPYLHSTWFPNEFPAVSPTGFFLNSRECHQFGTIWYDQPHRPLFGFAVRVGVPHRYRNRGMAQQLLYRYQVRTISGEARGERRPEGTTKVSGRTYPFG